ncbi:pyrroline-5-carboxylate reductase [Methylobacter sp. Wu8]|uniref:Pyrroline-5-carboxylate reductase n=1 Tax=Methylobacter tundripaludum TaxID=173365 RepID=A0A2S6H843_9GAMM|nr:pyrroline-5-carboxylate reductase [Methylobacter tundripaludum]MCF7964935.1 pyrroline-5-carboxylate reductase [Methylobacter tundripaludum]MCK9637580.1 pyrroline-5-carboxylate reductase [Methylobacter tundripaludum]PPK73638.1 pyrroline-5-carboxylate reductase [Methylobacter tundripaludum]
MKTNKIGFIGGGNMASSLISGLIASGHAPEQIWVSDINPDTLTALKQDLTVNTSANNDDVINAADVVVLAVKPQTLSAVAQSIAALVQQKKSLVVSIAAGINQNSLSHWLGADTAIVRCMPNTPALVLTGATALHANDKVTAEQRDLAENILRAVGIALWVDDEAELDAVTAVSGSGPAYYFLLMEAMEKAALELGLSQETARLLVQQTALGAAKIALESTESPEQLRKRVTSPGGTTQQAIETFEQGGFTELVSKALHAARDRSIEMSKQMENS